MSCGVNHLFVHAEGVLDGVGGVACHIRCLLRNALALLAGAGASAGDGVGRLLANTLLALWLDGAGNAVSGALGLLGALLENRLLAVRLEVGRSLVGSGLAAGDEGQQK